VVDGVAFPWEVAIPMRLHEVVKYHTQFGDDPGFFTAVFLFAMNKAKYDSLSADLKKVIDDNSGLKIAKWVGQAWDQAEVDGAAKAMTVSGTEIITIPPAELAKWKTATEKVDDAWVAAMAAKGVDGKALLADAKALIAKYKAMGGKGS
jgi:TRAP-type C4-dicarboxylate transport system substrate-binding protein